MICKTNDKHLGIFLRRSSRKAILQPTSRQTSALLYVKIYSEPQAWKAFLAHCPFKKVVMDLDERNWEERAGQVEQWASEKLRMNVGNALGQKRNRMYLNYFTAFKFFMRASELRTECKRMERLVDYFGTRNSQTKNVFFLEDVSMPKLEPETEAATLHTKYMPLPQGECECDPTAKSTNEKTASKISAIAVVAWMIQVWGMDAVSDMPRDRNISWRDVDVDPVFLQHRGDGCRTKLNIGLIADQGSSETRNAQLFFEYFPGHWGTAYGHRTHRNMLGISKPADQSAALWRTTLRAPKGSGEMQGRLRGTGKKLQEEAEVDPAKTTSRPFALEVLRHSGKESMAEALTDVHRFLHSSDARWHRSTLHAIGFQEHGLMQRLCIRQLAISEQANASGKKAKELLGSLEELHAAAGTCSLLDLERDGDDEAAQIPTSFRGYATEMDARFDAFTELERKAQIRIAESSFAFCELLESLNSFSHDDQNTFKNPDRLADMRRFLDPDATRTSSYTSAEIQMFLARRRDHIWEEMFVGPCSHMFRGERYQEGAYTVLWRVACCYFVEVWDLQWGFWESLRHGRIELRTKNLENLLDEPPIRLSLDAKRFGQLCVLHDPELMHELIDQSNMSQPLLEKETEADFKEEVTHRRNANAGNSLFSKEIHRFFRAHRHKKYGPPSRPHNPDRMRPLSFEACWRACTENCIGDVDATDEELADFLQEEYDEEVLHYGSAAKYFVAMFREYKEVINDARQAVEKKNWPANLINAVNFVGDEKYTSTKAEHLGYRGVKVRAAYRLKLNRKQMKFLEDSGISVADKKALDIRREVAGYWLMRNEFDNIAQVLHRKGGYFLGHVLTPGEQENWYRMPKDCNETKIEGDLLTLLYRLRVLDNDETQEHWIKILDASAWIHWLYFTEDHFPFASEDEQIAMLKDFLADYSGKLTETHMRRATTKQRMRCYRMHMLENKLDDNLVDQFIEYLEPKSRKVGLAGEQYEAKAAEEKKKKLAAEALKQKVRGGHDRAAAERPAGLSREKSRICFYFYHAEAGDYLGCARSHRRNQGEKSDAMRWFWKTSSYRPTKTYYAPGCPTEGNVEENAKLILVPKMLREYGLQLKDVTMIRDDQEECLLTDLLFDPEDLQPVEPKKPMKRGKNNDDGEEAAVEAAPKKMRMAAMKKPPS
eukprot:g13040.t1